MFRIFSTFFLAISFSPIGFCCLADSETQTKTQENDVSISYGKYLNQFDHVAFNVEYSSKNAAQLNSSVSHAEDWEIDFNDRALRKKIRSERYENTYSELVIRRGKIYQLSVEKTTNNATAFASWIEPPSNYWEKIGGFGETGILFGYLWNGANYYNTKELIVGGKVVTTGSLLTVTKDLNNSSLKATFDTSKGYCPVNIQYSEAIHIDATRNRKGLIKVEYIVKETKQIDGVWIPTNVTVQLQLPDRQIVLPDGFSSKNGVLTSGVSDVPRENQTLDVPASNVLTTLEVSSFQFLRRNAPQIELEATIRDGMPVVMQDARHLPHKWNGTDVIPNVEESFRTLADKQEFLTDETSNKSDLSPNLIFTLLVLAVVVVVMFFGQRHFK